MLAVVAAVSCYYLLFADVQPESGWLAPESDPPLHVPRKLGPHAHHAPHRLFRLMSTKPWEENKKRLSLVLGFFLHPEAPQVLRRASFVLQLSGGVEALTSTKPRTGEEPVTVFLVKGAAQVIVVTRLRRLFGAMHLDPALEPGAAACVLLATAADLLVRFGVFALYPFKLALLCRAWFPATWYQQAYFSPRGGGED